MKFIKRLIVTILLIIIVVINAIIYMGYNMYQGAIVKTSIANRIEEIQKDENYVRFSEFSDDFKHAIVAVEDHRFYTHRGIDLITTARSFIENIKEKDIVSGGSTITQQTRKTFIFYSRTTFFKKNCRTFCCI